jgi:hypothetical protein
MLRHHAAAEHEMGKRSPDADELTPAGAALACAEPFGLVLLPNRQDNFCQNHGSHRQRLAYNSEHAKQRTNGDQDDP